MVWQLTEINTNHATSPAVLSSSGVKFCLINTSAAFLDSAVRAAQCTQSGIRETEPIRKEPKYFCSESNSTFYSGFSIYPYRFYTGPIEFKKTAPFFTLSIKFPWKINTRSKEPRTSLIGTPLFEFNFLTRKFFVFFFFFGPFGSMLRYRTRTNSKKEVSWRFLFQCLR